MSKGATKGGKLSLLAAVLLFGLQLPSRPVSAPVRFQGTKPSVGRHPSDQPEVRTLEPGQIVQRAITTGEIHSYRITLSAGQYLRLALEQKDLDLAVAVFGPQGQSLGAANNLPRRSGLELISVLAEETGSFRLEVRSPESQMRVGQYTMSISELREQTASDRTRMLAQQTFWEASQPPDNLWDVEFRRQAIVKYKGALELFRALGDQLGEAQALDGLGSNHRWLGESDQAIDCYGQAVALYRALGDRWGEAHSLRVLGGVVYAQRSPSEGETLLDEALTIFRSLGEQMGVAGTYIEIGRAYTWHSQSEKAIPYFQEALSIYRAKGERGGEASSLGGIATAFQWMGDHQQAAHYHRQALTLYQALGNRLNEAASYIEIGWSHAQLGEHQKALEHYHKALPICRAIGNAQNEAHALKDIGLVYEELGEPEKALEYHRQALDLCRAHQYVIGEARTWTHIGSAHQRLGEQEKALTAYQEALTAARRTGIRREQGAPLTSLGAVYEALGQYPKALDYYGQALALWQEVTDVNEEISTLTHIGSVYHALGDRGRAVESYERALHLSQLAGDRPRQADVLYGLAKIDREAAALNQALTRIEKALEIIESLRVNVAAQEHRASYLATKQGYYEFFMDLLMTLHQQQPAQGYERAALQACERARARSLLETLTEARADIRQGVDPPLLQREQMLQQQLNAKAARLSRFVGNRQDQPQSDALRREIEAVLAQIHEVRGEIRSRSPHYAALTQPQPLSVREIQEQLLDQDTVLLEYALGKRRSFLWLVTPTTVTSYELPDRTSIDAAARRFYEVVTARRFVRFETKVDRAKRIARADEASPAAALALSKVLLGPVAHQLGKKRLVIVADGALQYVPFAALPKPVDSGQWTVDSKKKVGNCFLTPDPCPLILDHEIVNLPSASVMGVLRKERRGDRSSRKAVAVLADPVFGPDDRRTNSGGSIIKPGRRSAEMGPEGKSVSELERAALESGLERSGRGFPRLPFTRQEAKGIMGLLPKESGLEALDFEASRATAFGADLGQYRLVHIATHALINSVHPELSGLILSMVNQKGEAQEGFVRLHELYSLKLDADLVVLSACQTALGKEIRGEGLVGLTRGFMYAGASRVVASLWNVNDLATAELMKRFYRGMLKGRLRPAEALRAAQASMWKQSQWRSPYYWAGFVLQGEWR